MLKASFYQLMSSLPKSAPKILTDTDYRYLYISISGDIHCIKS
ncbi:hypothetical protein [uncultured Gammaproteobacteria bacterium]|nr:hypothetical protein [uncultured Gammaproteobacteria bacterium]